MLMKGGSISVDEGKKGLWVCGGEGVLISHAWEGV